VQTLTVASPKQLEQAGLPPDQVEPALREIHAKLTDRGPGGHILTGPIYIEDAEPGDTLEVRIRKIQLAVPYATNAFRPGRGFLPDDFPYARFKLIPLDRERMVARFAPGIEIPLRPFFGSMGVAPPEVNGRINSGPPWVHAGNLDNKELVAGTTLFIPVHARGALFEVGDGHAGQGNGEVDITALETSLTGTFQFVVRKDLHLRWPQRRDAHALHDDGTARGSDRSNQTRRARDDRLPGGAEASDPRRRLHAVERGRGPGDHTTGGRK
jgi:acetamidase/formamidase